MRRLIGHHLSANGRRALAYSTVGKLSSEQNARWTPSTISGASLTIVIVTYKNPVALRCTLSAFECQTLQNFDIIVLHDGADAETRKTIEDIAPNFEGKITYHETAIRHNDWGHSLRQIGIEKAAGDYLLITNGDNYYCPRFVEFAFDAIDSGNLDIVTWNFIHSHAQPGGLVHASYSPFSTFPIPRRMDIGSMLVKTDIAKRIGFLDRTHDADAVYLQDILDSGAELRIGKIDKTLMMHN